MRTIFAFVLMVLTTVDIGPGMHLRSPEYGFESREPGGSLQNNPERVTGLPSTRDRILTGGP